MTIFIQSIVDDPLTTVENENTSYSNSEALASEFLVKNISSILCIVICL